MGLGRSERKKEQTGAGAAGRGAKPGRAVESCGAGRKEAKGGAAGPASSGPRPGRGGRKRGREKKYWAFGPEMREGSFLLFFYFLNHFSFLNLKQIQM